MAIVSLDVIYNWFRKGRKPTEQQFADTHESFHHKFDGSLVRLNDEDDINYGKKTLDVVNYKQEKVEIPVSENYKGSMEDLFKTYGGDYGYKVIDVNGYAFSYRPRPGNITETLQLGDIILDGWLFGEFGSYKMVGADPSKQSSWEKVYTDVETTNKQMLNKADITLDNVTASVPDFAEEFVNELDF